MSMTFIDLAESPVRPDRRVLRARSRGLVKIARGAGRSPRVGEATQAWLGRQELMQKSRVAHESMAQGAR
jgi:hypothetical protein